MKAFGRATTGPAGRGLFARRPAALPRAVTARHAQASLLAAPRSRCGALAGLIVGLAVAALAGVAADGGAAPADTQARPVAQDISVDTPRLVGQLNGSSARIETGTSTGSSPVSGPPSQHRVVEPDHPDRARVSALAASGIPSTALLAYQRAAQREAQLRPGCRLGWPLLAAIGRVESDHGRFAGAVLHTDGRSTPKIIGNALDGRHTALIRDTDHGRLDGDTRYDRAVGPMQFIPSTWQSWGVDADHDGTADPFDIFDAAAAAADYLCAAGGDLATQRGQVRALLSYNHSETYVATVMGVEHDYANQVGLQVPVLPTPSQSRLPVGARPTLPPVDAAAPPALRSSAGPDTGSRLNRSASDGEAPTTARPGVTTSTASKRSDPAVPGSSTADSTSPGSATNGADGPSGTATPISSSPISSASACPPSAPSGPSSQSGSSKAVTHASTSLSGTESASLSGSSSRPSPSPSSSAAEPTCPQTTPSHAPTSSATATTPSAPGD